MRLELTSVFKMTITTILSVWLWLGVMPSQAVAACTGCLCPGNPCQLCPLPAMVDDDPLSDQSGTCARIKATVPPISDLPGSNEYFYSLDNATLACVREGGDVIRNSRRNEEFTSRFYCKPPAVQ